MNSHPVLGAEIIAPVKHLAAELPIIRHHHEWFNGSGYPDRLVGDEIPKLARILHVADAFEAMTAARPYRMTPLTPEQALGELRKFGGIQFDPAVVDAFVRTKVGARALRSGARRVPRRAADRPGGGLDRGPVAGSRQLPAQPASRVPGLGVIPGALARSGRRRAAGQPARRSAALAASAARRRRGASWAGRAALAGGACRMACGCGWSWSCTCCSRPCCWPTAACRACGRRARNHRQRNRHRRQRRLDAGLAAQPGRRRVRFDRRPFELPCPADRAGGRRLLRPRRSAGRRHPDPDPDHPIGRVGRRPAAGRGPGLLHLRRGRPGAGAGFGSARRRARTGAMQHPYVRLATNGPFSAMWLAQVISSLGDRVHQIALVFLVARATNGSPLALGLVFAAMTSQRPGRPAGRRARGSLGSQVGDGGLGPLCGPGS
jgi:hypothetical protein